MSLYTKTLKAVTSVVSLAALSLLVTSCANKAPEQMPAAKTAEKHMTVAELKAMTKIDAHTHISGILDSELSTLIKCLDSYHMHWISITTGGMVTQEKLLNKIGLAEHVTSLYPKRLAWATTFGLLDNHEPGWEAEAKKTLQDSFDKGAIGVKVWKEIGMVLRDPDSSFVMVNDPRFSPIFDYIASRNKTLYMHIGEPRNCWLPLDSMTVNNDRKYYKDHPQYRGYLHPEIPGYWKQVASRDSVVAHHPNLRVVGCHLGSLEWNVDELAKRFDKYPNFAVDLAARVCHLQVQDREKVRAFLIKYQDRVLYGTDLGAGRGYMKASIDSTVTTISETYDKDLEYFATGDSMEVWEVNGKFRGLELPEEVLRKIFHDNALKWFPGIFPQGEM